MSTLRLRPAQAGDSKQHRNYQVEIRAGLSNYASAPMILPFPQLLAAAPALLGRAVFVHVALEAGNGSEAAPADWAVKRARFSRHDSALLRLPVGSGPPAAGC